MPNHDKPLPAVAMQVLDECDYDIPVDASSCTEDDKPVRFEPPCLWQQARALPSFQVATQVRTVGFDAQEQYVDTTEAAPHLCKGVLLGDHLPQPSSLLLWTGAPEYSVAEVWRRLTCGDYGTCWLVTPNITCRCDLHAPRKTYEEESACFQSEELRCAFGFPVDGECLLTAHTQQWIPMGRRARNKPHGLRSMLTLWTSAQDWPSLHELIVTDYQQVAVLWQHDTALLRGFPQTIATAIPSLSENAPNQAVPVLHVQENEQQLELVNSALLSSTSLLASSGGTVKSNDPALVLLAQSLEDRDSQCTMQRDKLLCELARDHVLRYMMPVTSASLPCSKGDNGIAVASCAKAQRTILQHKLPPARGRGKDFEATSFLQFGAVVARGMAHSHSNAAKYGAVLAAIHHLAERRKDNHPYLAAGLVSGRSPWHQDLSIAGKSSTVSLGEYQGGLLEVLSADQSTSTLVDTHQTWFTFMAWAPHQVTNYTGSRVAVVLYTPQNAHQLPRSAWLELWRAGFPVLQFLDEELQRLDLEDSVRHNYMQVQGVFVEGCSAATVSAFPVLAHDENVPTAVPDLPAIPEDTITDSLNEHLDVLPSSNLLDLAKDDQMQHHLAQREEQKRLPSSVTVREPTSAQKTAIHKAHINLGHPRPQEFLRALRLAGVSLALRLWVRDCYKCPACQSMRMGGLRRPAILPRTFQFNISIAMDSFEIAPERLPPMHFVLIVDAGTRYIYARFAGLSVSTEDTKAALTSWVSHFGVPHAIQTDDGPEFRSAFSAVVEHLGAIHTKTDAYAPHQNGLAERQVGLVKHHYDLALELGSTVGDEMDLKLLMAEVISARNSFIDRSGHSSAQRVLGVNPRRPLLGVLQEDHLDFDVTALEEHDPQHEHTRAQNLRQFALRALIQQDAHTRVQRAMKARNRVHDTLKVSDWVYLLRSNRIGKKWREGPAIVTMLAGATAWVSLRGHLYKVATINLRKATEEEIKTVKSLNDLMPELQTTALEQRGRRRYIDVSRESPWDEAGGGSTALPSREMSRRPSTEISEATPTASASAARMPSTPSLASALPADSTSANTTVDPAQEAHATSAGLHAVRRGRSPSAPRRVRSRVAGPTVQAAVDRIETAIAQGPTQQTETATDPTPDIEMNATYVYTWSDSEALWTSELADTFFSDPDNDVPFKQLEADELEGFSQAMQKEAKSMMIDNHALEPLTLQESQHIRNHKAELILPSRWHFKRKIVETPEGVVKTPKARWILLGHKDAAAVSLGESSYAPTPSLLTINIVLQALASGRRLVGTADFSAAFLQANETTREVYISQPNEGVPGLDEHILLRMRVEIYGSTAGPSSWRNTLVPYIKKMGYRQSVYDPCLFILPPAAASSVSALPSCYDAQHLLHDTGESLVSHIGNDDATATMATQSDVEIHEGLMVLLVDDMLEGGGSKHDECMADLKKRFNLGKHVKLSRPGGALFNGRRLTQDPRDYSIRCSMKDYIDEKMEQLTIPKKKRQATQKKPPKDSEIPLNAAQCQLLRTITAKILWVARQGRPDVLGCSSFLSQVKADSYTMEHLRDASRAITHLKQTASMAYTIHSIPPKDIRLVVYADGSPGSESDHRGQGGVLIGFTTNTLQEGYSAPVSFIAWRGGRLDRVVTSSLAAEAYALQGGVAMAELCNNIWLEASNARWSLTWARHNLGQWESGVQRSTTGLLVARADCSSPLLESVCVTDAKSLFDSLKREAKSREPRVAVAVAELKQGLSVLNLGIRWIPHQEMICDGFTKSFSQGHLSPLLSLMRTGFARLVAEDKQLENRKLERLHKGYNSRSKEHMEKTHDMTDAEDFTTT
eukprot:5279948-Amphidinium_carterae.1